MTLLRQDSNSFASRPSRATAPASPSRLRFRRPLDLDGVPVVCDFMLPRDSLPRVEAAPRCELETQEWARSRALDYPAIAKFFPHFGARATVPTAGPHGHRLLADWYAMLFAHDDLNLDRVDVEPQDVARRSVRYLEIIESGGRLDSHADDAIGGLIADLCRRSARFPGDAQPFLRAFAEYIESGIEEVERRCAGTLDRRWYLERRPISGAVVASFELAHLVCDLELPDALRDHEAYRNLVHAASMHICVTNDLLSLPKELRAGDGSNIAVIEHARNPGGSWSGLFRRLSAQYVRGSVVSFEAAARRLRDEAQAGGGRDRVERCVDILSAWMVGHLLWEEASRRHEGTPASEWIVASDSESPG